MQRLVHHPVQRVAAQQKGAFVFSEGLQFVRSPLHNCFCHVGMTLQFLSQSRPFAHHVLRFQDQVQFQVVVVVLQPDPHARKIEPQEQGDQPGQEHCRTG